MAQNPLKTTCLSIKSYLHQHGFTHLQVMTQGKHLIIYSTYDGEKEPRARLGQIKAGVYRLGMANHRGQWEATPYIGTVDELLEILVQQFAFILIDF